MSKVISKYKLNHDGLECQFCSKICKNRNSLCNHERLCKENPNRQESPFIKYNDEREHSWNYGLTKETDERVAKYGIAVSKALKGKPGHPHTEEFKQKQRENALKNGLGGFNMRRGIYYNGIKLDSSYEVLLAEDLDRNNIQWERPSRIPYHVDGKLHHYTPDFFLPDYNIYLDPKNDFLINNINPNLGYTDIFKINQVMTENNIRILVLDKDNLTWEKILTML